MLAYHLVAYVSTHFVISMLPKNTLHSATVMNSHLLVISARSTSLDVSDPASVFSTCWISVRPVGSKDQCDISNISLQSKPFSWVTGFGPATPKRWLQRRLHSPTQTYLTYARSSCKRWQTQASSRRIMCSVPSCSFLCPTLCPAWIPRCLQSSASSIYFARLKIIVLK